MLATSILILLVICALLCRKRKSRFYPTPQYSGGLPLIGNVHQLPRNEKHCFRLVESVLKESLKEGKNISLRIGPTEVIVLTDPEDSETVLNSQVEKNYLYSFAKVWIGDGLVTAPHVIWNNHRKIMYPMFNIQVLNSYIDVFNRQARRLVSRFDGEVGKGPFDHRRYLVMIGLETICQTALGVDIGDQNLDENKRYSDAIDGIMDCFVQRFKNIFLHFDRFYQWSATKKVMDGNLKVIHGFSMKVIENKEKAFEKKSESERDFNEEYTTSSSVKYKTLVDHLMLLPNDKKRSKREIREQLDTLVATGFDTSAHELLYTLMLLGTHQDIQENAYKEIQEIIGNTDRDVDRHDLPNLIYMEAVLKETLRLYPVTPVITRKNTEDIKIKHCTIPAGSECFVSLYGINRHPIWGPDAETFRPERWLEPETLPQISSAFAAFGLGKRSCIGKNYAMMSMKTTLVHVLRNFRVKSDISKLVLKIDPVLRPAAGQHISLELRTNLKKI